VAGSRQLPEVLATGCPADEEGTKMIRSVPNENAVDGPVSVAELGVLTGSGAPGFGPSFVTTPPDRMLYERVSVGVVAEPWK